VSRRPLYLIFVRLCGWLVLLAISASRVTHPVVVRLIQMSACPVTDAPENQFTRDGRHVRGLPCLDHAEDCSAGITGWPGIRLCACAAQRDSAVSRSGDLIFLPAGCNSTFAEIRGHHFPGPPMFGYSMGSYLVARAAAFDHRVAGLILDDGIYDLHTAFTRPLPPFLASWIAEGRDDAAIPVLSLLMTVSTPSPLGNEQRSVGLRRQFLRRSGAQVSGVRPGRHRRPDHRTHPDHGRENDQFLKGEPQVLHKALNRDDATLVTLTIAEGAGEHTHAGALGRAHQVMFDWLDTTLTR
jgi:hypothetical protein